jgi:hypothetical protein
MDFGKLAILGLSLGTCACGAGVSPYTRATAGRIGCPASQIELHEVDRSGPGPQSWVAFCGRTGYACSSNQSVTNADARIICSELGRPGRMAHWHPRNH